MAVAGEIVGGIVVADSEEERGSDAARFGVGVAIGKGNGLLAGNGVEEVTGEMGFRGEEKRGREIKERVGRRVGPVVHRKTWCAEPFVEGWGGAGEEISGRKVAGGGVGGRLGRVPFGGAAGGCFAKECAAESAPNGEG